VGACKGSVCNAQVCCVRHTHALRLIVLQLHQRSLAHAHTQDAKDASNAAQPGSGAGGIDMNLLSTVLAALMAVVREMPGVFLSSYCLAPHLLRQLLAVVCPRLADDRLTATSSGAHSGGGAGEGRGSPGVPAGQQHPEVAQQVHRAMNKLAIAGEQHTDMHCLVSASAVVLARILLEQSLHVWCVSATVTVCVVMVITSSGFHGGNFT
jgi:hypothetical protein